MKLHPLAGSITFLLATSALGDTVYDCASSEGESFILRIPEAQSATMPYLRFGRSFTPAHEIIYETERYTIAFTTYGGMYPSIVLFDSATKRLNWVPALTHACENTMACGYSIDGEIMSMGDWSASKYFDLQCRVIPNSEED